MRLEYCLRLLNVQVRMTPYRVKNCRNFLLKNFGNERRIFSEKSQLFGVRSSLARFVCAQLVIVITDSAAAGVWCVHILLVRGNDIALSAAVSAHGHLDNSTCRGAVSAVSRAIPPHTFQMRSRIDHPTSIIRPTRARGAAPLSCPASVGYFSPSRPRTSASGFDSIRYLTVHSNPNCNPNLRLYINPHSPRNGSNTKNTAMQT